MPTVPADGSPVLSALIAMGGFLVALIGGVIAKVYEGRKTAREGVVLPLDSRGMAQLQDQITDQAQSMREIERAVGRVERVVLRNQDILEDRNRRDGDFDQRIATAISKLRDKP